jgi:hypothetical protein
MLRIAEWGMAWPVLGLLAAMLLLASVHFRRQIHRTSMRAAVGHIDVGALTIVRALAELRGMRLSRELRVTLRAEVVARYRRIGRLVPRYPAIRQHIADAEAALQAEGEPLQSGVGRIDGDASFRRLDAALGQLMQIVGYQKTLQPIPADVRAIFYRELGERRAEVWGRFFLVEATRQAATGHPMRARTHLTTLMNGLRRNGPRTPFVNALYGEARQALLGLGRGHPEPVQPASARTAGRGIATRATLSGPPAIPQTAG